MSKFLTYVALTLFAVIALTPMYWLVQATLRPSDQILSNSIFEKFTPTTENYTGLFTEPNLFFGRYVLNSVFIACSSVCLQLFFSSLAGFGLAKYEFKGKGFVMALMLATMMIPGQVTMAPSYELLYKLHLVDTYAGLIVPGAVSVFGIFLFRQSIQQVPDELIHAARVDGCTEFGIYWNIILPVVKPMVGAFCLMAFMGAWNSFLWPQVMLHTNHQYTLPIALSQMVGIYQQKYGLLMAGTLLSVLPVVALFFALQKEFVAGLTSGAVKG